MQIHKRKAGFTLIELLVVIAVVGVLAGAVIAIINPSVQLGRARNAQRKNDLRSVANALEQYLTVSGSYPPSTTWCNTSGLGSFGSGSSTNCTTHPLTPLVSGGYLKKLPVDPSNIQTGACGYIYFATSANYKFLAYCSPEGVLDSTDPFKDPPRATSWSVYSPGGSGY